MYPALIFLAQMFYSVSDLLKKMAFRDLEFSPALLTNPRFVGVSLIAVFGALIQLYVLSRYDLSRTAIFLGIFALILSSLLGVLVLHEKLSPLNWLGVGLAVVAIALVNAK